MENAPTGILVSEEGDVKIFFTFQSIEYYIPAKDILYMQQFMKNADPIPIPKPPMLEKKTDRSLRISWKHLPFPAGVIDIVEVQYMKLAQVDPSEVESGIEIEIDPNQRWKVLTVKHYYRKDFLEFTYDSLGPGRCFCFRLKYHCNKGWSEYSLPSPIYCTNASKPPPPAPPSFSAITSNAAELKWSYPSVDNGSKIFEYVLVGKAIGDEFSELYRGPNFSYLILGLYPEYAYSFMLAVVNKMGQSEFSSPVSFQTPMQSIPRHLRKKYLEHLKAREEKRKNRQRNPRSPNRIEEDEEEEENLSEKPELFGYTEEQINFAMNCIDAWNEFWDPKTEQFFYFNTILGFRQLKKPEILITAAAAKINENDTQGISENKLASSLANSGPSNVMKPPKAIQEKLDQENLKNQSKTSNVSKEDTRNDKYLKTLESNYDFRKRRYQFIRAVNKKKKSLLDAHVKSMTPQFIPMPAGRPTSRSTNYRPDTTNSNGDEETNLFNRSMNSSSTSSKNDIVKLDLHRETILYDYAQAMLHLLKSTNSTTNINVQLLKRFKVHFINEDGIDSGGLSKEAFLLVSKDIFQYVKNSHRNWMNYTKGYQKVVKEADAEGQTTNESQEEEEFIDGLFFAFDYKSSLSPSNSETSTTTTTASPTKSISSYLEKEFLTPSQVGTVLGTLFGKAILDGHLIDFPLSSTLINYALGKIPQYFLDPLLILPTTTTTSNKTSLISNEKLLNYTNALLKELKPIDPELYKSLIWMKDNNITDIIDETFTVLIPNPSATSSKDAMISIALCPNGDNIPVTETNKIQYLYLILLYKFKYSIQEFIESFLSSFHLMIPLDLIKEFQLTNQEFYLIVNGKRTINIEELRAYCIYESVTNNFSSYTQNQGGMNIGEDEMDKIIIWNETNEIIMWLWRMIRETNVENKKLFIQFFTGTTCIPLDGFNPPITIVYGIDMQKNSLPKAHICFHQLVLPAYDSYEIMKEKLFFALYNANNFGFS